ncbi:MAG: carbohydrate ABC transporter permease [Burkholderiaceae bacterium]|jgi:multiple sugar transport system permease protein|nr:carbohydrate ABC transporter permease [Burkholderiaceae bacterium]
MSLAFRLGRMALIGLALAIALAPFVVLFLNSLRPADEFLSAGSGLIPSHITFAHYAEIFDPRGDTFRYLLNSLIITASSTLIAVLLGAMAAYALARLELPFRLSILIGVMFLVIRFYPKITVALPYFLLMRQFHLLDTHVAVIIAHVSLTVPFVVWMLLAFFEDFPRELEQAAMVDGCGAIRRFTLIILPLMAPALAAAAVLTAFMSWNEFLMASTVAPNAAKTLPVRISGFITDKGILWGSMSAMSSVIVIPVALFALFTQRYLARGLTVGAVKG